MSPLVGRDAPIAPPRRKDGGFPSQVAIAPQSCCCTLAVVFALCAALAPSPSRADEYDEITYTSAEVPQEVLDRATDGLIPLDAASYIQSGLVGHFDAIRNVGASLPHDATATEWKNLVSGGPDAAFTAHAGYWSHGDSFYFTGYYASGSANRQYARLKSAINTGSNIAVQLVMDVDYTEQNAGSGVYPIFFHDGVNELSLFFNNNNGSSTRNNTLYLKADKFGAGNNNRPSISNWDGHYATFSVDDSQRLIGETASATKTRSATPTIASFNYQFSWFGTPNSDKYEVKGRCHAVRIYTAALTDEQLAWNRFLDEMRFRGNCCQSYTNANVVVESNVAGVRADQDGKYLVSGHYDFTAPSSVTGDDGCVYAPAGYTLEVWDAAAKTWGLAEAHDGETTFSYTNCTARSTVRIIWNWTLQSGVKRYDADSYLQGGLLLNYDGIRNTGLGEAHSTNATTWANLGSLGSTRDAAVNSIGTRPAGEWSGKSYVFRGGNYFAAGGVASFGQRMTAQVVTDSSPMWRNSYRQKWPSPLGCTAGDNTFIIYGKNGGYSSNTFYLQSVHTTNGKSAELTNWNGRFFNAIVNTNIIALSDCETTVTNATGAFDYNSDNLTMTVGACNGGSYDARGFGGRIYSARWYNRILTDAEMAYNNDIDWCRFFGATGRSSETDLVEVRCERPEIELNGAGVYIVRGEGATLTVSAPAVTNIGGVAYTLAGCRIETWNASTSTWGAPVETPASDLIDSSNSAAATVELRSTDSSANRRLVWLYTLPSTLLRAASEYDTCDYVQNGLVAHFDGIWNEGRGMPHGTYAAALWRNLVTDSPDVKFSSTSAGDWNSDGTGFTFAGVDKACAKMKSGVSLGTNLTVQLATDIAYTNLAATYATFFASPINNFVLYEDAAKSGTVRLLATHVTTVSSGNRPTIKPWGGKYLSAIIGNDYEWYTETTNYEHRVANSVKQEIQKYAYEFGGADFDNSKRYVKGDYYSVRLYNRALTEAELAQNRRVDEIRFRGAGDVTVVNGEIGDTGANGESSVADGVYNLESGTWTFTAPEVVDGGVTYRPRLLVETYDEASGEWTQVSRQRAGSYTYDKSAFGGIRIRLTWTWEIFKGLLFIIR